MNICIVYIKLKLIANKPETTHAYFETTMNCVFKCINAINEKYTLFDIDILFG